MSVTGARATLAWLVVAVGLATGLAACSRAPDLEALCARVGPCETKSVSLCVVERRRLYDAQKERGCGDEGAEVVACEIEHGRCESSGSLTLFMPTDRCLPAIDKLGECFDRTRR